MESALTLSEYMFSTHSVHSHHSFSLDWGEHRFFCITCYMCDPCIVSFTQAGETGMSALRKFSRAGINMAATTVVSSAMRVCILLHVL